jgi:hypothetical protein
VRVSPHASAVAATTFNLVLEFTNLPAKLVVELPLYDKLVHLSS